MPAFMLIVFVDRQEEPVGFNYITGNIKQGASLFQAFPHQGYLSTLQVAQSTMDQLAGF